MDDVIVIGAGLGGLTAAALLAKAGARVTLLEAHAVPGGCASYFSTRAFLFDAGATTLSGMRDGQPVAALLARLDLDISTRRSDPGMIIHTPSGMLRRHAASETWIAECERVFGCAGQRPFWTRIDELARQGWEASLQAGRALPLSLATVPLLAGRRVIRHARLVPSLFRSLAHEVRRAGLGGHKAFNAMIDEQLMITTQSSSHDTPLLLGAMGLQYPADTWYVDGGLNALPRALLRAFRRAGGCYRSKERVVDVEPGDCFTVRTAAGNIHRTRRVVSNLTAWDTMPIVRNRLEYMRKTYRRIECRGALTYYAGVRDAFDDFGCYYHQLLSDERNGSPGGRSLFVSLSHPDDRSRSPEGYRTMTVSTHVEDTDAWLRLDETGYLEWKEMVLADIERTLSDAFTGYGEAEKPVRLIGTPRTFARYTGRHRGWVGGVPQSMRRPLFTWQGHRTRVAGLHMVGDTVYPGQGAPAVVMGAMQCADEIRREA
jgi:C-3',4' desaturase CrtD